MANDRGDTGYVEGSEPRPTFLEPRKTKKTAKIIELSDGESGIPEEKVIRENIPKKNPHKKKTVAQNLKDLKAVQKQSTVMPEMQEQDRRPSATQSVAPAPEPVATTPAVPESQDPEEAEDDPEEAEDDPEELRLSVDSEDEAELTAEQEEGLSLAEEVIHGGLCCLHYY